MSPQDSENEYQIVTKIHCFGKKNWIQKQQQQQQQRISLSKSNSWCDEIMKNILF